MAVVNELGKSETQHLNQRIQTSQLKGITAGLDGGKTYEEARISEVMNQYQGGIQAMLDGDPDAIKAIETKQALKQSNEEAHRIQHERLEAAGKKEAQDMMEKIRHKKRKAETPKAQAKEIAREADNRGERAGGIAGKGGNMAEKKKR